MDPARGPPERVHVDAHVEVCPAKQTHTPETVFGFWQVHIHHEVAVSARHPEAQLGIFHGEVHAVYLKGLGVPGTEAQRLAVLLVA